MERYWLFTGVDYYPFGGWKDFSGSFITLEEARKALKHIRKTDTVQWWQIVDIKTKLIVEEKQSD